MQYSAWHLTCFHHVASAEAAAQPSAAMATARPARSGGGFRAGTLLLLLPPRPVSQHLDAKAADQWYSKAWAVQP